MARNDLITSTCTPAQLVDANPCLKCLSDSQLDIALMYVINAWANSYLSLTPAKVFTLPTDLEALLQDAACMTCLDYRQMKQAVISLFAQTFMQDTPEGALQAAGCLLCLKPDQVWGIITKRLCDINTALPT